MAQQKILHIDMDAFFAAVEQRDNPAYSGKPLIVGGKPDSRGVVAACSYEARKYGIHSAMSSAVAYRRCNHAIFVKPRFEAYKEASRQIQKIFTEYTPLVEPLSLDEAYLDVTECSKHEGSATRIAQEIKHRIKEKTGLTASAGVSYNKFLAKIASDMDKPDGLFVIKPDQGARFVEQLPIRKFHGIGAATEKKMKALGIYNGADLRQWALADLQKYFGKSSHYYFQISRGVDDRPVRNQRTRKSIGSETTFANDICDQNILIEQLNKLGLDVGQQLQKRQLAARTVTVKVKYANFEQVTRSYSTPSIIEDSHDIEKWLPYLLMKTDAGVRSVRLLGVTVSSFAEVRASQLPRQLSLF